MNEAKPVVIFWFRRDLRLHDNKGLYHALRSGYPVVPLFIFDEELLDPLPGNDHRVVFIHQTLQGIHERLQTEGKGFLVRKGKAAEVLESVCSEYDVQRVYCNEDHEPYGRTRDEKVAKMLHKSGLALHTYLDHLVMHKDSVLVNKDRLQPYRVFTPYSRAWKAQLTRRDLQHYSSEEYIHNFYSLPETAFPAAKLPGILPADKKAPPLQVDETLIRHYQETRDYPALEGTSRLGVHLRFGTVSIRQLVKKAMEWNQTFLNELIWREFYAMILWHYPYVVNNAFKPLYDRIEWVNNEEDFQLWKQGRTGYPMVDAGMRQLKESGYMHNRLRMITASFLSKHLLIDWRWGEAWFAELLFDYELSSNNGGWQWSAGTGCDAAPYFRIFNPMAQQQKFDPEAQFIRRWVNEFDTPHYPQPMIDHAKARERCLRVYRQALNNR